MDYDSIINFIGSVGFPIVACFMMYKQNTEVLERIRNVVEENTLTIKELVTKLSEVDKDEN